MIYSSILGSPVVAQSKSGSSMKRTADSTLSSLELVASISNSSSSVSIKSNTRTTNSFFRPESGRLRCFKTL